MHNTKRNRMIDFKNSCKIPINSKLNQKIELKMKESVKLPGHIIKLKSMSEIFK